MNNRNKLDSRELACAKELTLAYSSFAVSMFEKIKQRTGITVPIRSAYAAFMTCAEMIRITSYESEKLVYPNKETREKTQCLDIESYLNNLEVPFEQ